MFHEFWNETLGRIAVKRLLTDQDLAYKSITMKLITQDGEVTMLLDRANHLRFKPMASLRLMRQEPSFVRKMK